MLAQEIEAAKQRIFMNALLHLDKYNTCKSAVCSNQRFSHANGINGTFLARDEGLAFPQSHMR